MPRKSARKTTRKATKKKTTKKKAGILRKAAKKIKKAVKKKPVKRKVVRKPAKKKPAKNKPVKKKPVKKKPVKRKAVKQKPAAKKTAKRAVRRKPSEPLFERIVPERPPEPATGDNPYNIKIVNMVASANFNVELDLFALAREVDTIEYEPEQFPGAILKLAKPRASLLLFKNGKVICTGARSEEDVEKALMETTSIISAYVS